MALLARADALVRAHATDSPALREPHGAHFLRRAAGSDSRDPPTRQYDRGLDAGRGRLPARRGRQPVRGALDSSPRNRAGLRLGAHLVRVGARDRSRVHDDRRGLTLQPNRRPGPATPGERRRVEELGGGSSEEIIKEYNEVFERDQFLEREILDLEKSAETLKGLILDLDEKLALKFKEGITKINKEFHHFFEVLFDGGNASLTVIEQKKKKKADDMMLSEEDMEAVMEEEVEAGIDINVSLPRKKIKGLQMLSGGERALTSIALLFAMSQVNPPPFLVLDETEAALDEANSRKYSAMIKDLSQKTQLILVTHNRETMSVAGVLYGVTMGSDGISKLLSVKLEEAVRVAK